MLSHWFHISPSLLSTCFTLIKQWPWTMAGSCWFWTQNLIDGFICWIHVAQDRVQWRAVVDTVMNLLRDISDY
jgi:hypothetical protein